MWACSARSNWIAGLIEELTNLTTYQQSYNASARLIQAVSNLLQILLQLS